MYSGNVLVLNCELTHPWLDTVLNYTFIRYFFKVIYEISAVMLCIQYCFSLDGASVVQWSERLPFTSEVAGSIQ